MFSKVCLKRISLLIGILTIFQWAHAQCKADFTWNANGYVVSFSNNSSLKSGYSCYWNFGDGNYSNQVSPRHAYTKAGKYIIYLFIQDTVQFSCSDIFYDTIETQINGPNCKAAFSYTMSGDTVTFDNLSTGVDSNTTYLWNFGDGYWSNKQTPIHRFKKTGYRKISLKIQGAQCNDTASEYVFIQPEFPATAFFTKNQFGEVVHFAMDTINPYLLIYWQFGDGQTSKGRKPIHSYGANGKYQVCLMVQDTMSGLVDQYCDSVFVTSLPNCRAAFSYTIFDKTVSFNSLSTGDPNHYFWEFGDGKGGVSWKQNPTYAYDDYGTYRVRLWIGKGDTTFDCTDDEIQYIKVEQPRDFFGIQGYVYAETNFADKFHMLLYAVDSINQTAAPVDSLFIDSSAAGYYSFMNVPRGKYILQAIPAESSILKDSCMPTYSGNSVFWDRAEVLVLDKDFNSYDLRFVKMENYAPMGIGRIGGIVFTDNSAGGSKSKVSGMRLYLTDNAGNLLDYRVTDSSGLFTFSGLSDASYYLQASWTAKRASPLLYSLNNTNRFFDSIRICVSSTAIYACKSLSSEESIEISNTRVYPNPSQGLLFINEQMPFTPSQTIYIYNLMGQKLMEINNLQQNDYIDATHLNNGMYIIQLGESIQRVIIQH